MKIIIHIEYDKGRELSWKKSTCLYKSSANRCYKAEVGAGAGSAEGIFWKSELELEQKQIVSGSTTLVRLKAAVKKSREKLTKIRRAYQYLTATIKEAIPTVHIHATFNCYLPGYRSIWRGPPRTRPCQACLGLSRSCPTTSLPPLNPSSSLHPPRQFWVNILARQIYLSSP